MSPDGSLRRKESRPATCFRLLCSTTAGCSILLGFRFGLICLGLLILQCLDRIRIRSRCGNFAILLAGVRSLRKPAASLLLREFLHAAADLLAEMVVHFLQVLER